MRKLLKNKKGMTLTEVVVALAVLGIVSAPLLVVFTNSAVIVKKTGDRIEINAVTRVIKENVINSVKYGSLIYSYKEKKEVPLNAGKREDLQIKDSYDNVNEKYVFDAVRIQEFDTIADPDDPEIQFDDTCEYLITLKKMDGSEVQKLKVYINRLEP